MACVAVRTCVWLARVCKVGPQALYTPSVRRPRGCRLQNMQIWCSCCTFAAGSEAPARKLLSRHGRSGPGDTRRHTTRCKQTRWLKVVSLSLEDPWRLLIDHLPPSPLAATSMAWCTFSVLTDRYSPAIQLAVMLVLFFILWQTNAVMVAMLFPSTLDYDAGLRGCKSRGNDCSL